MLRKATARRMTRPIVSNAWRVPESRATKFEPMSRAAAALPRVKLGDGGGELRRAEVGPHRVGEIQLRVRALPQQEVRQSLLSARADQEIHVRQDDPRVDRPARGVVDGESQMEARAW